MIRVCVMYPHADGARFDHEYYERVHIPMALELLGPALRSVTVERGLDPGQPWPSRRYVCLSHFTCDSLEAYQAALAPHAARLQSDMANFTDIAPILQVSRVALATGQG